MFDDDSTLVVATIGGSHFVNHAYLTMVAAVLTAVAATFHVSLAAAGLAIGVQGATVALLQLPMGYLSDVRSRELVLGLSLGIGALGAMATALAPSYHWLLVAQVVTGIGIAGHHPAHYPMLSAATKESRRGRAFSAHAFAGSLGFAAPFALAPAVVHAGGTWRHAVFLVGAVGLVYAVVAMVTVRTRISATIRTPQDPPDGGLWERTSTLTRSLGDPAIVGLAALALVVSAAAWGIRSYGTTLLERTYQVPGPSASLLLSAMFAVGAGLIILGGWLADRHRPAPILLGGFAALAVGSVALGTGHVPVPVLAAVVLPLSGTISLSRPARSKLADGLSGRDDLGKNFALITIGISGGAAIAPPVFGYVVDTVGVATVFTAIGGLALVAIAVTLLVLRIGS